MIGRRHIEAFNQLCKTDTNAVRELLAHAHEYTDAQAFTDMVMKKVDDLGERDLVQTSAEYLVLLRNDVVKWD